jgi:Flp pilus assembly pilin Flp
MLLRDLIRDETGGPAAEFALVLPLVLIFLLGTIDVGTYIWQVNRAEKALHMGARYAVATDSVASGLADYDFTTECEIPGGNAISSAQFPGMICTGGGTLDAPTATCALPVASNCATAIPVTANPTAMGNITRRMRQFKTDITPANVEIGYAWSGLGYAGDPNGSDVAPIMSITAKNLNFNPLLFTIWGGSVEFPDLSYSLTMEDGKGTVSN